MTGWANIRVRKDVAQALQPLAEAAGLSLTAYVRSVLAAHLADPERAALTLRDAPAGELVLALRRFATALDRP